MSLGQTRPWLGLLAMKSKRGTKRSAGGLLARGEQLCEAGRLPATRVVAGQLLVISKQLDRAGRRPATKVVAGELLAGHCWVWLTDSG